MSSKYTPSIVSIKIDMKKKIITYNYFFQQNESISTDKNSITEDKSVDSGPRKGRPSKKSATQTKFNFNFSNYLKVGSYQINK